jgi:hypothetical protein
MNAKQVGPLMGILFIVLVVVAFVVGGETPDSDETAKKVVDFYTDNDTQQIIAAAALIWAGVAFMFFVTALRTALRGQPGDDGGLSTAMLIGGVVLVVGMSLFAGLTFALADAADDIDPSAVQAMNVLNSDMFATLVVGSAVFNLGLGLAVLRHGGLPRWVGWLAVVLGVVSMTPLGFFAFLATAIVIIATSVVLWRNAAEPSAPAPSAPAAAP